MSLFNGLFGRIVSTGARVVYFVVTAATVIPMLLVLVGPHVLRLAGRIAKVLFVLLIGYPRAREGAEAANQPPSASGSPPPPSSPLRVALEVIGAAAGVTLFVTFIGGAILWARFHGLGLPADEAVAIVPRSVLISVGAGALAPAIILAGAVAFLAGLTKPLDETGQPRYHFAWILRLLLLAEIVALLWAPDELDIWPYKVAALAVAVFGAFGVWGAATRLQGYRPVAWTLFAAVALVGGVNAYVTTLGVPEMEPAAVLFESEEGTSTREGVAGFYVGQTSDRLYIAPLTRGGEAALGEDVGVLLEIPRAKVRRLGIREQVRLGRGGGGRAEALALLADLRRRDAEAAGKKPADGEDVPAVHPERAVAPLLHLHDDDPYRPVSARFFLDRSQLRWADRDNCRFEDPFIAQGLKVTGDDSRPGLDPLLELRLGSTVDQPGPYPFSAGCGSDRKGTFYADNFTRPNAERESPPEHQGFYLDISGLELQEGSIEETGGRATFNGAPAYFEKVPGWLPGQRPDAEPKGMRIIFWFLYTNSVPPAPGPLGSKIAHEGDWERISVLLEPHWQGRSLEFFTPVSARFHAHEGSVDVPWDELELEGRTHPVAYSAVGSHATYPAPGIHESTAKLGKRDAITEDDEAIACGDCPQWRTWREHFTLPASGRVVPLLNARLQPWYGFGGAWGRVGPDSGRTGPLGPSIYKLTARERQAVNDRWMLSPPASP